jgi:chromosome segregation ATPase
MDWLKPKTMIVAVCVLAVVGVQDYGLLSTRSTMEERFNSMEDQYAKADERVTVLTSDLDVVVKKLGVTTQELQDAQELAKQLKLENARVRRALTAKADSKAVLEFQKEAATKIDAVHQEATTKIDGINGDVKVVRTDLDETRNDLKATRSDLNITRTDLSATRDEVANSRRDLGSLIARNSTELADLRRKGEREYVEFDLSKAKEFKRVGDIMLQLKKTDVKKQKFEVVINADDNAMQKKDRMANEPVTFLVGKDRLRYELVVNYVDKDRIRGYISSPKERLKSAEILK